MKIFYNPKTLKVMGSSDDANSMDFPFVTTNKKYHSLDHCIIEVKKDKATLKIQKKIQKKPKNGDIIRPRKKRIDILLEAHKQLTST